MVDTYVECSVELWAFCSEEETVNNLCLSEIMVRPVDPPLKQKIWGGLHQNRVLQVGEFVRWLGPNPEVPEPNPDDASENDVWNDPEPFGHLDDWALTDLVDPAEPTEDQDPDCDVGPPPQEADPAPSADPPPGDGVGEPHPSPLPAMGSGDDVPMPLPLSPPPPPVPEEPEPRHREQPAKKVRRAGEDGWPSMDYPGNLGPAGRRSTLKWSINQYGHLDVRATCCWCGKTRTKTYHGSEGAVSMRTMGQGRGLGALWAFLDFGEPDGSRCGLVGNDHRNFFPSYEERKDARARAEAVIPEGSKFREERPRRPVADGPTGEPWEI